MIYSRTTQYAVRMLIHLAQQRPGTWTPARALAAAVDVPKPFLSKIVQSLVRGGLIRGQRGPGGGVALRRPAADITVGEVMQALREPTDVAECFLGYRTCTDAAPCPVHHLWTRVRENLRAELLNRRLGEFQGVKFSAPPRTRRRARKG